MALINCPECGSQISDKAFQCIHCGYPLKDPNGIYKVINGVEYDLSFLKDCIGTTVNRVPYFNKVEEITGLCTADAFDLAIDIVGPFPETKEPDLVKCPRCKCTDIGVTNKGFSIITGFIGSGITLNVCKKCGYKWRP